MTKTHFSSAFCSLSTLAFYAKLQYTGFGMGYDIALEQAWQEMKGISPYVVASKSGAEYDKGQFKLPFFNRTFIIHFPEVGMEELGIATPPAQWLQVLLLHYLLRAKGIPVADEWIAYRNLPGAHIFERRFINMAINPLQHAFDDDVESFTKAGLALGGTPMPRTGDAAFRFLAFPKIPMACIFYLGEEEMPSRINILFDAAAHTYLHTEDLSLVGTYLSTALQKSKSPPVDSPEPFG
jgi:hypothetical protein